MDYKVFYSWQSDLPNNTNRGFIEAALKKAAETVTKDDSIDVEPVIDRDTAGLAGSPEISASIFGKIDVAKVFVADVSVVNSDHMIDPGSKIDPDRKVKRTPNPNVLLELGYAAKSLGWDNVLLVCNTAYGTIEDLPFDLRMRRVQPYFAAAGESDRSDARKNLTAYFEAALRAIIAQRPPEPAAAIAATTPADLALSAIEDAKPNQVSLVKRYWKWLVGQFGDLSPDWTRTDLSRDELLQEAITRATPLIATFVRIADAAAGMGATDAALELGRGFEELVSRYNPGSGFSGQWNPSDFDFYKFLGHELYVDLVACLVDHGQWENIDRLFSVRYFSKWDEDNGLDGMLGFQRLSEHVATLEDRNRRLGTNRSSVRADVLKEIHEMGELGELVPFEQFMQADYLCFLRGEFHKERDEWKIDWRPWSSVYLRSVPRILVEARRGAYAAYLAKVLGATEIRSMADWIGERAPMLNKLWNGGFWDNPVSMSATNAIGKSD